MANKHRNIDADELWQLATEYMDECIQATQEQATGSGKIVEVKSRHIPTIGYFCDHWIRRKDINFYTRVHFHRVINLQDHPLSNTIKSIDEKFRSLAEDIVANEGKGIFYAKNRLGMTDRLQTDNSTSVSLINIDPLDDSNDNDTK